MPLDATDLDTTPAGISVWLLGMSTIAAWVGFLVLIADVNTAECRRKDWALWNWFAGIWILGAGCTIRGVGGPEILADFETWALFIIAFGTYSVVKFQYPKPPTSRIVFTLFIFICDLLFPIVFPSWSTSLHFATMYSVFVAAFLVYFFRWK